MNKQELEEIIQANLTQIVHVNSCFEIWKGLHAEFALEAENNDVFRESPYFWQLILKILQENFLMEIAKLYDENKDCLGLKKIINICEQNQCLFPAEHKRQMYNVFEKKEYADIIPVDISNTLKMAKELYGSVQESRNKLITLRDKHLAHSDKKYAENPSKLYKEIALNGESFERLISVAHKILNDFLSDLIDRKVSGVHMDCDDYKYLLSAAYRGIKGKESI